MKLFVPGGSEDWEVGIAVDEIGTGGANGSFLQAP